MPQKNNHVIGVSLMLICTACVCIGQLVWKVSDSIPGIFFGFVIYGIGALFMIYAYHYDDVSVLQPINSISYVVSAVLGALLFQETISPLKILALAVILLGVFVLAGGGRKAGQK